MFRRRACHRFFSIYYLPHCLGEPNPFVVFVCCLRSRSGRKYTRGNFPVRERLQIERFMYLMLKVSFESNPDQQTTHKVWIAVGNSGAGHCERVPNWTFFLFCFFLFPLEHRVPGGGGGVGILLSLQQFEQYFRMVCWCIRHFWYIEQSVMLLCSESFIFRVMSIPIFFFFFCREIVTLVSK